MSAPITELVIDSVGRPQKRRLLRMPVNVPVVIEQAARRFDALVVNLGLGGAFVETSLRVGYGEQVEVSIELPGLALPARLAGVVRWHNPSGFGVQFLQMGARETYAISALLALTAYVDSP